MWVRVFWLRCGCSGVGAGVQVKVRVFWRGSGCSVVSAGVLGKVQVFWSVCFIFDKVQLLRSGYGSSG